MELMLTKRFKQVQKEHYGKHLPVKRVNIKPSHEPSRLTFSIDVEVDKDLLLRSFEDEEQCRKYVVEE